MLKSFLESVSSENCLDKLEVFHNVILLSKAYTFTIGDGNIIISDKEDLS